MHPTNTAVMTRREMVSLFGRFILGGPLEPRNGNALHEESHRRGAGAGPAARACQRGWRATVSAPLSQSPERPGPRRNYSSILLANMSTCDIGLIGLAVMGENLVL